MPEVKASGPAPRRSYHSPLRTQTAALTRQAIVEAAHELLVDHGYRGCSIADIAARAGVARPTVLATFGSKAAILREVVDQALAGDDEPVPVAQRSWFQPVWQATTADACAEAYADACLLIGRRTARVFEAVHRGADEGGEVADLWEQLQATRRAGAAMVVDRMLELDADDGGSRERAVDAMWILNDPALYRTLVLIRNWAEEDFRTWLAAQMRRAI